MLGVAMGLILDLSILPALQAAPPDGLPPYQFVVDPEAGVFPMSGVHEYQAGLFSDLFGYPPDTPADWVFELQGSPDEPGVIPGSNRDGGQFILTATTSVVVPLDPGLVTPAILAWAEDHAFVARVVTGQIATANHVRGIEAMAFSFLDDTMAPRHLVGALGDSGFLDLPPVTLSLATSGWARDNPQPCQPAILPDDLSDCELCDALHEDDVRLAHCELDNRDKEIVNDYDDAVAQAQANHDAALGQARVDGNLVLNEKIMLGAAAAASGAATAYLAGGGSPIGVGLGVAVGLLAVGGTIFSVVAVKRAYSRTRAALQQQLTLDLAALAVHRDAALASSLEIFIADIEFAQGALDVCRGQAGCPPAR